jgi:hypothetical protein
MNNTVDHILAEGDVRERRFPGRVRSSKSKASSSTLSPKALKRQTSDSSGSIRVSAPINAEMFLTGSRNLLTVAILTGNVQLTYGRRGKPRLYRGEQIRERAARDRSSPPRLPPDE